jgi:hypothetical protein
MTRSRRILAGLIGLTMALGVPAALVLGTSAPARACTYIVSGDSDSTSSSGGTPGCQGEAIYRLTATPATVAVGDPITLTMQRTDYPNQGDVTAGTFFSISSGTCAGNVCTPAAAGTVTISGRYINAAN